MQKNPDAFAWLRGILVLWIVLGHMLLNEHFHGIYSAGFASIRDVGVLGKLLVLRFIGVDILFMLSGLLLGLKYHALFSATTTGKQMDRFYLKRLWRIYPLHLLTLMVIGAYAYFGVPHPIASGNEGLIFAHWEWSLGLNLLLMHGWGIMPLASWNEPSWNLSIFFLLYILFPNLLLLAKRLPEKPVLYVLAIGGLIAGYALCRTWLDLGSQSDGAGAILRGLTFFSTGILLACYSRVQPRPWPAMMTRLVVLGFIALIMVWTYMVQFPLMLLHMLYPALLLALLHGHRGTLAPAWGAWLGARSFALFLTHYPTLLLLRYFAADQLAAWAAEGPAMRAMCYVIALGCVLFIADIATRLDWAMHRRHIAPHGAT